MGTNRVSRRQLLQLATVTSAGVVLAACSPASAPQPTAAPQEPAGSAATSVPAPAQAEAVKITVFVGFGTGTDPSQIEAHNQIAKEYNDAHQDIQIEFLTVPHEENNTKFATMLSGDMAPDIAMPQGLSGIAVFYDEWLDIAPYIERDKYDTSDFAGTTAQIFDFPGRLLGLPMGIYPQVVYYNENLFDAAGLDYPPHRFGEKDWTYENLVELARKLTIDEANNDATSGNFDWQRTKQWGWDGLSWLGTVRDVAPKWGGSSLGLSDDYKTAQYTAQPYIDCTQWTVDNIFKWHIRANGEQAAAINQTGDPMGSGMVAMWECWSWMNYAYSGWTDTFNWDVAAVPMVASVGKPFTDEDADNFTISKSSKHPDQAWEVSKYFISPEILVRLCDNWGAIPARQSTFGSWQDGMVDKFGEKDWQVFLDSIDYMFLPNSESWVPDYGEVMSALVNAWDQLLNGITADVKATMEQANQEIQGYLDAYWSTHTS